MLNATTTRRSWGWCWVVVGDLNAENHDAALRYLLDGGVAADDPDW